MSDEERESKGFQVRDRRRFDEKGSPREESGDAERESPRAEAPPPAPPPEAREPEAPPPIADGSGAEAPDEPPDLDEHPGGEIGFLSFVMSLSTQALACLGEIPDPRDDQIHEDRTAARELIDILSMLKEKTTGNLDPEETRLLEEVLYELRMRFVAKARS